MRGSGAVMNPGGGPWKGGDIPHFIASKCALMRTWSFMFINGQKCNFSTSPGSSEVPLPRRKMSEFNNEA